MIRRKNGGIFSCVMSLQKTLSSTDKEIYYLSEKGLTQKEIADRLGYKTHSAVSKRMKIMNKDFKKILRL